MPSRFKIFGILSMLIALACSIVILGFDRQVEDDLPSHSTETADHPKEPRRLSKIPGRAHDEIPKATPSLAKEDLLEPIVEGSVGVGWAYEGDFQPPNKLLVEFRFLELRNPKSHGQEGLKELGTMELEIPRDRRLRIMPPSGTNAVASTVKTEGVTQLVSNQELTTWPFFKKFELKSNASEVHEFTLRISDPAAISGVVINEQTRAPEAQVEVMIFREGQASPIAIQKTKVNGVFTFDSLADGFYGVMIKKPRKFLFADSDLWNLRIRSVGQGTRVFRAEEKYFDRTIGDAGALVIRISEGRPQEGLILPIAGPGEIVGVVRNWRGKFMPNFQLTARFPSHFLTVETVTDLNGNFKIPNCVPGNWRIALGSKNKASELDWVVAVNASETTRVELDLPKPKRVRIIAESVDGEPIPNASFHFYKRGATFGEFAGILFPPTNSDGKTELAGIVDRAVIVVFTPVATSKWLPVGTKRSPKKTVIFGTRDTETVTFQFVKASRFRAKLDFTKVSRDLPAGSQLKGFMATFSLDPGGPQIFRFEGNQTGEIDSYFNTTGPIFIRSVTLYIKDGGFERCYVPDSADQPLIKGQKRLDIHVERKN